MEQAFYGKNVQATLALGEARGMALFVAGDCGLSVFGYAPARVKRTIVGHGRASKPPGRLPGPRPFGHASAARG